MSSKKVINGFRHKFSHILKQLGQKIIEKYNDENYLKFDDV